MTKFLNGPAAGQILMLKRTPIYLRVVQGRDGKWDALDQPDDAPRPGETAHAYRLKGEPGYCHVRARGNLGGFYSCGEYEVCPLQPDALTLATAELWQNWCLADDARMNLPY